MKFYHRLPWLVMALFMYGLYTWLCSLSKHNSITVFNCSISVEYLALSAFQHSSLMAREGIRRCSLGVFKRKFKSHDVFILKFMEFLSTNF